MASKFIIAGSTVLSLAMIFQFFLKERIWLTFGINQNWQKIDEFPYKCRRLIHPLLESCEDLVLDTKGRTVYVACSSVLGRNKWCPAYRVVPCVSSLQYIW